MCAGGDGRASLWRGRRVAHEFADEVMHQLQGVEAAFAPYKVVADAREWDDVNPGRVVASLL